MMKMVGKEDSRQENQPIGTGNQKDVSNPNRKPETVPEGWRRDEPEEERRARTTGGTHHHTSHEVKEGKVQTAGIGRFKQMKKQPLKTKTPPPTISVLFVDQTKGSFKEKGKTN